MTLLMMTWGSAFKVNNRAEREAKAGLLVYTVRPCRCAIHCCCACHVSTGMTAITALSIVQAASKRSLTIVIRLCFTTMQVLAHDHGNSWLFNVHMHFTFPHLQEAFDIFGDVGELLEMYDARKRTDTDDAEAEQEPDFSDEEAAETFRIEQVVLVDLFSLLTKACASEICPF